MNNELLGWSLEIAEKNNKEQAERIKKLESLLQNALAIFEVMPILDNGTASAWYIETKKTLEK